MKKIKVSHTNEANILDVLLSTDQQFQAVSINEYRITDKQYKLLQKKNLIK